MPKNGILIGGAVLIAGFSLIMLGTATSETPTWKNTDVSCLPGGHANVARHFHPELSISIDGTPEVIPGNIGVTSACMAEVHTHDVSGKLHVETTEQNTTITLSDFLSVWDKPLERDGYTLSMRVNGASHSPDKPLELARGQQIQLIYESMGTSSAATTTPSEE